MRRPHPGLPVPDNAHAVPGDALPVMVPRNDRALVPTSPDRVQKLRNHLAAVIVGLTVDEAGPPPRPQPEGFAARVARTACALCRGWCCRNGGDDGFLDGPVLSRVGHQQPKLNAEAMLRLYADLVPAVGYKDSCIFHGKDGCTLDRSLRSDVCNSYFCGGLHEYVKGDDVATPVVVIAGEGGGMRTSPLLSPDDLRDIPAPPKTCSAGRRLPVTRAT
jgi:hypothetical protein